MASDIGVARSMLLLVFAPQLSTLASALVFPASAFHGIGSLPRGGGNGTRPLHHQSSNAEHLQALTRQPAGWNCSCSDQQLCRPLSGRGSVSAKEVIAVWGTEPEKYRPLSDIEWNTTTTLLLGAWPGSSIWSHEVRGYFLVFVPTISEIRYFYREM
eukprot:SAG31_NODE_5900_length_2264_cov_4.540878_1_plen_157_part_00